MDYKHTDVTELIIKAFYKVYGALGYGFLEKVYGNAMAIELRKLGLDKVQWIGSKDRPSEKSNKICVNCVYLCPKRLCYT